MVATLLSVFSQFIRIMSGQTERTLILIKPDGVQRHLIGEIITRFEKKGYTLVGMKYTKASGELLDKHYSEHVGKGFYKGLRTFMSSGPLVAMVWQGLNVVKTARFMMGETQPEKSTPGTIRGDFAIDIGRNIIHGSDAVETAKTEISIWFKEDELVDFTPTSDAWVYE